MSEKTEQPTQKKLADSRKKGQVGSSKETTNVLMIITYTIIFAWLLPGIIYNVTVELKDFIELPHELVGMSIGGITSDLLSNIFRSLVLPIILIIITGISSNVVQNGFIFSAEPIIPKLNKISPVRGLKRIFSSKSLVEVTSSILKLTLVTAVILIIIKSELSTIITLSTTPLSLVFTFVHKIIIKIMVGVIIIMSFIAILDLLYKNYDHKKGLRMSKQEVKDEMKQTEGNPEVKAKLRKMRTDITNLNINDAIKTEDVVISNPEHFAIALQYDMEAMPAPKVVAKGRDHIALKIKELAKEFNIVIVENKPLARILFDTAKVDDFIPEKHYKAVAEVINYIYKLRAYLLIRY